jgi:hypothetical protein
MQLQRGGALELAMGGQPSHVVKAVAGAGGLDGGEVPGRSRWHRRQVIVMGGAESNHGAMVRSPTHSTSHSSSHRRARGAQGKGLRAPATHSNTHRTTHSNTHRSWSQPCEWRGSIESSRLMIGLSAEAGAQETAQLFSSCECCCECCCEYLGATGNIVVVPQEGNDENAQRGTNPH